MEDHDHGERWDDSDIEALKDRLAKGHTYEEIGDFLGRTTGAVASKVRRLKREGWSLESVPGPVEAPETPSKPPRRFRRLLRRR